MAQWSEHPNGLRRVVGSNPIWGSDFSDSPISDSISNSFHIYHICSFSDGSHLQIVHFRGTLTSQAIHFDLYAGTIHLTFPPNTVAEPTRIMVCRWKYGACLPHLADHEAVVSNVIEISATTESGASKFNSEVKLALSHSATDLEGYELVIRVLTDVEKNEWEEIPGCEDIRQVSGNDFFIRRITCNLTDAHGSTFCRILPGEVIQLFELGIDIYWKKPAEC